MKEELGFTTKLEVNFSFIYKAVLDNELIEHEFDHVLTGKYNLEPKPNPLEVEMVPLKQGLKLPTGVDTSLPRSSQSNDPFDLIIN